MAHLLARALAWGLLLGGCGRTALYFDGGDGGAGVGPRPRDSNFVGLWRVDQPAHALYEATFYALRPDGALDELLSIDLGNHLREHGETGSVASSDGGTSCTFGGTDDRGAWWSPGPRTLVILGECSDARAREIELLFERAPAPGVVLGAPTIVSVGGAGGWEHDNFEWRFYVCAAGQTVDACQQDP